MVLDEAHGVKNMKTARWNNLKMLRSNRKLLLSGTPVQNNLRELLVLLDFLSPDIFNFRKELKSGFTGDSEDGDPIGDFLRGLGLNPDGTHDKEDDDDEEEEQDSSGSGSSSSSSSNGGGGGSGGKSSGASAWI